MLQAGRVLADTRGSNSLKAYMRLLQDLAAAHVQRALQAALEASLVGQVSGRADSGLKRAAVAVMPACQLACHTQAPSMPICMRPAQADGPWFHSPASVHHLHRPCAAFEHACPVPGRWQLLKQA